MSARHSHSVLIRSALWLVLLYGCSVSRYIPENEVLYTGADIDVVARGKISNKSDLYDQLEEVLYPQPNSTLLGMRPGLLYHYKAQREKPGFINRFLNKKFGENPVYLSSVDVSKTEALLDNRLENNGFFQNQISSTIDTHKKHGRIHYQVTVSEPYRLHAVQLDSGKGGIYQDIRESMQATLLQPGRRFNLSKMKDERSRIDEYLKSIGYYNFNGDFLIFEADTNQYQDKQFDLYLRLKKDMPLKAARPYRIRSIEIYPRYMLHQDSLRQDTTMVDSITVIQQGRYFKPELLPYYLLLKENTRYNPTASKITSKRFASIGAFKYVNIRHEEATKIDSTDTVGWLNTRILLSPTTKRSLRAELQAVSKSNNYTGPTLKGTYTNRNLFSGGEILQFSGEVGYEMQVTGGKSTGLSSTKVGFNSDLIFPRLIPIRLVDKFRYDVPKTKVSLGVEYLNRSQLYRLRTFSTLFGYNWNTTKYLYQEINPIYINLLNLSNTTSAFETILEDNPYLASTFEQQFIGGLTYSFTYNQVNNSHIHFPLYVNGNFELAGNTMNALSNHTDSDGKETFLGFEYAQYVKSDVDIRLHFDLGKGQQIVTRAFGGLGIAYGNSDALPFSKQYYAGGPYSVRAFQIRSIGPGTYQSDGDNTSSYFDRTGDIRLEGNIEYRFPIYSVLKGALFADAGNVWLRRAQASLPGGKFTRDFYKQLGVGTGIGLRVDVQNFVIRGDFAFPLHQPDASRYKADIRAIIFNFAIGYPF